MEAAARVEGDRTIGKDFERLKRVALVSCMDDIFIRSTKEDCDNINSIEVYFLLLFAMGLLKWSVL